jgi:SAM-dependent methyltransferase
VAALGLIRSAATLAGRGSLPYESFGLVTRMLRTIEPPAVDLEHLRRAIQAEYALVAENPEHGFHFLVGYPLAKRLGYADVWLVGVPESSIASFAGTGNPFSLGVLALGERVVDVGSGGGIDSLIAARMVGAEGHVIGVDMTPEMLSRARASAIAGAVDNVEFREGFGEALPVADGWADVVISNGVLNLMPDKDAALHEMARILKPGGRLQVADILVQKPVPPSAKEDIALWTG